MNRILSSLKPGALAITLLLPALALAQPPSQGGERGERRGPPAEAIEACVDLVADDVCGFEDREGDWLEGVCFKPEDAPAEAPLACKPENAPDGPPDREGQRPRD